MTPQLSITISAFEREAPGSWQPLLERAPEIGPTMDGVPGFVDLGVTDFYAVLAIPDDPSAAEDYLADWVIGFRAATA